MSTDENVTKELVETLEDGRAGFSKSAEKLKDSSARDVADELSALSEQRRQFSTELRQMAKEYGDSIDESGSMTAALHRGWISLKDALGGDNPSAVLKAAEQGEEHAISEYEKALKQELSPALREVVQRQLDAIRAARSRVQAMQDAH